MSSSGHRYKISAAHQRRGRPNQMRKKANKNMRLCTVCPYSTVWASNYYRHMRQHGIELLQKKENRSKPLSGH